MYESNLGILTKSSEDLKTLNHSLQVLEIDCFRYLVEREGEKFIQQHYTNTECSVTDTGERRIQYLAGRLAAKKAVATVINKNERCLNWLDIEILRLPTGQPAVVLCGRCQEIAAKLGIKQWLLSISHTATYAVASAIAVV